MDEREFIDSIDGRFPHGNLKRALELVEQGVAISSNAAFMVVHEVCIRPQSADAEKATLRSILAHVEKLLPHPLTRVILPLARDMLDGGTLSVAAQIEVMRKVSAFPDQYNALAIPLYARDSTKPWDEEPDRVYDEIVKSWLGRRT